MIHLLVILISAAKLTKKRDIRIDICIMFFCKCNKLFFPIKKSPLHTAKDPS